MIYFEILIWKRKTRNIEVPIKERELSIQYIDIEKHKDKGKLIIKNVVEISTYVIVLPFILLTTIVLETTNTKKFRNTNKNIQHFFIVLFLTNRWPFNNYPMYINKQPNPIKPNIFSGSTSSQEDYNIFYLRIVFLDDILCSCCFYSNKFWPLIFLWS